METQIYRIRMQSSDNSKFNYLEISVCTVCQSEKQDKKEISVCLSTENNQLDGCLDESELDSLMKFLSRCQTYINSFNSVDHGVDISK